jgi:hypothetical protein
MKSAAATLRFLANEGIVLQSAQHPAFATLTTAIVGARIRGSWWAHPKSREIFRVLSEVYESPDVVATRLVAGKVTLIHRRLWPALETLANAGEIDPAFLAKVTQEHTDAGHHEAHEVPFPLWLPKAEARPTRAQALTLIGASRVASLPRPGGAAPRSPASAGRAARARRR